MNNSIVLNDLSCSPHEYKQIIQTIPILKSVEILLVMDCTYSMGPWVQKVKN